LMTRRGPRCYSPPHVALSSKKRRRVAASCALALGSSLEGAPGHGGVPRLILPVGSVHRGGLVELHGLHRFGFGLEILLSGAAAAPIRCLTGEAVRRCRFLCRLPAQTAGPIRSASIQPRRTRDRGTRRSPLTGESPRTVRCRSVSRPPRATNRARRSRGRNAPRVPSSQSIPLESRAGAHHGVASLPITIPQALSPSARPALHRPSYLIRAWPLIFHRTPRAFLRQVVGWRSVRVSRTPATWSRCHEDRSTLRAAHLAHSSALPDGSLRFRADRHRDRADGRQAVAASSWHTRAGRIRRTGLGPVPLSCVPKGTYRVFAGVISYA
jgi:hypothetical protein